jgi:hypothetical protein
MNTITSSSPYMARAYAQTTSASPTAVARINAAAFHVSLVVNQPVLSVNGPALRRSGSDTVSISPAATALLQERLDIRPVARIPVPAESKKGLLLSITV